MKNTGGAALRPGARSPREPLWLSCGQGKEPLHLFHGCAHAQALVRTHGVIELHGPGEEFLYLPESLVLSLEEPAVLHGVVHSLSQCVVQRVARLRHAYPHAEAFEQTGVFVAAVLDAAVGVVYQAFRGQALAGVEVSGHPHGPDGAFAAERGAECPAHDEA